MSNKKTALTDVALRKLKATGERIEITDTNTTGLRARASATGEITFILKTRDAASSLKTITLGRFPEMSLKEAREAATQCRLDLKAGKDINGEKRAVRAAGKASSDAPTLKDLLLEYEARFSPTKKSWQPRGPRSTSGAARMVIERVYAKNLQRVATTITEEDFAQSVMTYERARPAAGGKKTANGQASRARAYLAPVLDWAAGRKGFAKIGASRSPRLAVASLDRTHDPATEDPSITGKRTRVLTEDELVRVLPLLIYPSTGIAGLELEPTLDYRAIAMRFILYTAARLEEVCAMRWGQLDRKNRVWHKPKVKSTRGGPRGQNLPLSDAAFDILASLPGWTKSLKDDLVFPNGTGCGMLDNWDRFQRALNKQSGTSGWHRHDLRRTAATIMTALKVPASTVAQILAHKDPLRHEGVGGAASNYIQLGKTFNNSRDPQEEALSILAEALASILAN